MLEQHANELSKELKNVKVDENEVNKFYDYETQERAKIKYALNFVLSEKKRDEIVNKAFKRFFDEKSVSFLYSKRHYFDEKAVSKGYYMNFDELKEMAGKGMIVGSYTHPSFLSMAKEDMLREIITSFLFDLDLKKIFSPYDENFDAKEVPTRQSGHGTSATGAPRQNRGQS